MTKEWAITLQFKGRELVGLALAIDGQELIDQTTGDFTKAFTFADQRQACGFLLDVLDGTRAGGGDLKLYRLQAIGRQR